MMMWKTVTFAAILLVGVNCDLLGAKPCTYGPSYWCSSLANVAQCSAMQHCVTRVWNQPDFKATIDSSDACTFCKDMVGDVKAFIESNQTKATILQYMNRACDFMPDQFSMNECKKVEEHYFDEFYQIIDDNIDPDTICNLIKLCGNSAKPGDLKAAAVLTPAKATFAKVSLSAPRGPVQTADGLCDECKTMVTMVKTYIDDKDNQDAMKNFLEKECQALSVPAAECDAVVSLFLPEMINVLDQELTDKLCTMLGLCNSTTTQALDAYIKHAKAIFVQKLQASRLSKHITGVASRVSADACTTCEEIINYVKLFINNNNTEQEISSLLENDVCPQLGEFSSMCKELVEQYFPQVWAKFIDVLDPKTLCTDLGLCGNTSAVIATPKETKPKIEASVQCVVCEFVMTKLESMLSNNATEQEITKAVEKVCSILPSSISTECDTLVEKYGPAIINLLVHDAAPSVVCGFLGLCSSGDALNKASLSKVGDDTCMMCDLAMTYVKSILSKNATEQEIERELETLCSHLPTEMTHECNTMIQQYTPEIIQLLTLHLDPKTICSELGLCKAAMKVNGLVHLYNKSNV